MAEKLLAWLTVLPLVFCQSELGGPVLTCPQCIIHPDSVSADQSFCNAPTGESFYIDCQHDEGCWTYETELFTLKGCSDIIPINMVNPKEIEGSPGVAECTKFWQNGVCLENFCVSCSLDPANKAAMTQLTLSMGLMLLTVTSLLIT